MATYDVDANLQEEGIYDWLVRNEAQTQHGSDPIAFAQRLEEGARAYLNFSKGRTVYGQADHGLTNTRSLGGSAVKQHFVLLLAGRHLSADLFQSLTRRIEETMFVWLISGVSGKDYERLIVQAARRLRQVSNESAFETFEAEFFQKQKQIHRAAFQDRLGRLHSYDLRKFRLRYILAKLTRHFDVLAYGLAGREGLAHYLEADNDIEHILASGADEDAKAEFGDGAEVFELVQRLGNLMLIERSVNRVIKNRPYSEKAKTYPTSQFLLARCQSAPLTVGVNDKVTQAVKKLNVAPIWNRSAIEERQRWIVEAAAEVWDVPLPSVAVDTTAISHGAAT